MKKITYWKLLVDKLTLKEVVPCFNNRAYKGTLYDSIMLVCGSHKMEFGKTNMLTEKFTFAESTEECWSIYVPDYEEEKLLHEIRELIKRDNCLGVSFAKIDNMTIKDMWDIINNKLDKENQALLIKLYIQNLYHKQKFHKHTKVIVHPDWDSANREEYGIDEIHTITGSRADNEHIEVTFNKGSKFTEKHGRNYDDVVQIDFV